MPKHNASKPPSQRQLKVAENLRHALAQIFLEGEFPSSHNFDYSHITVSEVRISPDLKNATVFVTSLTQHDNMEEVLSFLEEIQPEIRRELSAKVNLRYLPKLIFKLDSSFSYAHQISTLLNDPNVKRDIENNEE